MEAETEPWLVHTLAVGDKDGDQCSACAAAPGHSQVVSGSEHGAVVLWPGSVAGRRPLRIGDHKGPITSCCVVRTVGATTSKETIVATSSMDTTVSLWRGVADSRQTPAVLRLHVKPVRTCDISRDARFVLSGSDDKLVKVSSVPERRFMTSLVGHTNWVRSAVFSPCARHVASGSDDRSVRLWDVEASSLLRSWHDQGGSVTGVRFDASGTCVVAGAWDSTVNIWDLRSQAVRQHYGSAHGGSPITSVSFHPSQELLLSSATDGTVRMWDLRAGRLLHTVQGHQRPVHTCAWTMCDEHSFLSCDDRSLNFWKYQDGSGAREITAGSASHVRRCGPDVAGNRGARCKARASSAKVSGSQLKEACVRREPSAGRTAHRTLPRDNGHRPADAGRAHASSDPTEPAGLSGWVPEFLPPRPSPPVEPLVRQQDDCLHGIGKAPTLSQESEVLPQPELAEAVARTLEQMVSQMDVLTRSIASIEARLGSTEAAVLQLRADHQALRQRRAAGASAAAPVAAPTAEAVVVEEI